MKKDIFKKWWFWIIAIVLLFLLVGIFAPQDENINNNTKNDSEQVETNEITTLKKELEDKYSVSWFGEVRNDTTGKWRLSEYASNTDQTDIAIDYYKAYFEDDKEIHALINMTTKKTARISLIDAKTISVSIYDYVKGEEHDAKKLFGGSLLAEYHINIETNEKEKIN